MHCVGSAGNTSCSRPRKEKRLTYVLNAADDTKHSAGINCLDVLKSTGYGGIDYLFTGSRDGTLKRWAIDEGAPTCSSTFESHTDWVNDAVVIDNNVLVSCSSDTTLKTWNCLSDGVCTKTLHQHSDYVTCLAAAGKNSNIVASGGLGGEVFIWDIEAATAAPVSKSNDRAEEDSSSGANDAGTSVPLCSLHTTNSSSNISFRSSSNHGYLPISAKGNKESVYALAMNESGKILVSGGTEKVVRVWDPRSGSKTMKLRGHTDNVRALLLDSTGRFSLSGSSDSMIRLWDLGQQRCLHSYAVHTDSVWALASTASFTHVYSGGRDQSLCLTDLSTRESILLCAEEYPILRLAMHDESMWVATTDSSARRWPLEGPQKVFQKGGSFLSGNFSFSRTRASLEGNTPDLVCNLRHRIGNEHVYPSPLVAYALVVHDDMNVKVPVYKVPILSTPGVPAIVQHEILNDRRHVLTKDIAGSVKLWEITRGIVAQDYGEVSFQEKKEELFEMVSIPSWFTTDTKLGCLAVHLETPQCFSAEMYSIDLNIVGNAEDDKVNLARETLKGLLAHWLTERKQRLAPQSPANGELQSVKDTQSTRHPLIEVDGAPENDSIVYPQFEFSFIGASSIITEGSHGGVWRRKITDLDGTEDEKDFPSWVLDCLLNNCLPPIENTKYSFYLHPYEGSSVQIHTQGKLSAPRILRIHKVINYVVEKIALGKPLDGVARDGIGPFGEGGALLHHSVGYDGSLWSGLRSLPRLKPPIEILCNNQVLSPEMSLATVRTYIWKKSDDLVLHYRLKQGK